MHAASGLQKHGRRGKQRGADARRPGAAAEATGAAAALALALAVGVADGVADGVAGGVGAGARKCPFRDVHEARHAEQSQEECAENQEAPHLLVCDFLVSPTTRCRGFLAAARTVYLCMLVPTDLAR